MPLPTISTPTYELTLPSSNKKIRYRPFLVKEEKILIIAMESQDPKQIAEAIMDTIVSCAEDPIDKHKLTSYDVEYLFMQIRSKSVGETSTVLSACTECREENEVKINLADINVKSDGLKTEVIEISDDISLEMKYPTYEDTLGYVKSELSDNAAETMFNSIATCINAVQTKEENILLKHEPREEIETFINSLTTQQLEKITSFVDGMPTLIHEQKYTCKKCGHENTLQMKGLQDFF